MRRIFAIAALIATLSLGGLFVQNAAADRLINSDHLFGDLRDITDLPQELGY